jgi:hypothetical protein
MKRNISSALCTSAVVLIGSFSLSGGSAQAHDYGADTCKQGFVWREAFPGDTTCVTPSQRRQARSDNYNAGEPRQGAGAYGPKTCKSGYVWRESYVGDTVCVTPAQRAQTKQDNSYREGRFKY